MIVEAEIELLSSRFMAAFFFILAIEACVF